MTIINGEHYDTYEQYCEEVLSYMKCQHESFDFGEGEMSMSSEGGEYSMYKFSILGYLNSFYDDYEFSNWWKYQQREEFNRIIESRFDELSDINAKHKLHNKYDRNMNWRSKRVFNAKYRFHTYYHYPYYTKFDEAGNEYLAYSNIPNSRDKGWCKNKRKVNNKKAIKFAEI